MFMCFTVGAQLFILAIVFVQKLPFVTGFILFLLAFPGVYPAASKLYTKHQARAERRLRRKN